MTVSETTIPGLLVLTPRVFSDERGYFKESYNQQTAERLGINNVWVQDNESRSGYGVVRGLHFQLPPYTQAKLVRVILGEVFDVAVDLRPGSPTFGKWEGRKLSAENHKQFYIPKGFAHGFSVLSKEAVVFYKCDAFYSKDADTGIRYNDPVFNIDWKIPEKDILVSAKDKNLSWFDPERAYFTGI